MTNIRILKALTAGITCAVTALGLTVVASAPARADTVSAPTLTTVGTTKASTYQTNGVAWATAYANGVVYVGGTFTSVRPSGSAAGSGEVARANLAAFNASTGALLPCNPGVALSGGGATVRALTPSSDGKTLYIGGFFGSVAGQGRSNLAALDTTSCAVKTSFAPAVNATVRAIAVGTTSSVYFGGDFHTVNGQTRNLVAAVDAGTGATLAWDPDAVAPTDQPAYTSVRALTVSADNSRVVLGGDFDYLNGVIPAHRLAIVDATQGAILNTFPGFIDPTSAVKVLVHDADNFYLGAEGTGGGVYDGRAAFNINTGALVWRDNCLGATQALYVQGGVLYNGSHAHDCHATPGGYDNGARHHLLAQSTADATILPWFPNTNDGINEQIGPRGLTMSPDGALWVVGEFTTVNGVAQQGITRFPPQHTNNVGSAPVPTLTSTTAGTINVRWKTTSDIDAGILTYRLYRDGVLINTQSASSRFFDRPQLSFLDTVAPGSFHVYRLDVSDGTYTSALGGTAGGTAATTSSAYVATVLADHPSNFWRLDDAAGSFAADSAGTDPGIYPVAVTNRQAGEPLGGSSGATFTATANDPLAGIQANNRQDAPTTYSTELWFRTTTTTGGELIGFGNASRTNAGSDYSNSYDRHIYMTNSGQLVLGEYAGYTATVSSARSYNDGAWHQVTGTLGPDGTKLYVDGVRVGAIANTAAQTYAGYWRIGNGNLSGWPASPSTFAFKGTISDVAVYPTVLSRTQVFTHYTGAPPAAPTSYPTAVLSSAPDSYWRLGESAAVTTAADATGNGNTASYRGGVTPGVAGVVPNDPDTAAAFDGVTGSVVADNASNDPESFSTELWFKTATVTGGELLSFGNNQNGASGAYDRSLYLSDNGRLTFGIYNNGFHTATSAAAYNDNAWHYAVATLDPNVGMTLYVDGVAVATDGNRNAQGYTGFWKAGGDNLGGWPGQPTTTQYNGTLDEVAVYSAPLSAAEVSSHYRFVVAGSAPVNQPPVAAFASSCTDLSCAFDGTGSDDADGTIASYAWTFGDSATGTGSAPSHAYAAAGQYTVTLTVTDDAGATDTVSHQVTVTAPVPVNQPPVAAFASSCTDLSCAFDGTGSADADGTIASYAWTFGDSATGTGSAPSHAYAAAGQYTVTLTVTDNSGATDTVSHQVTVTAPVPVNQPFASDAFSRLVSNGFGTADVGGAWTVNGTASNYLVANGVASIVVPAASGSGSAWLHSTLRTDADIQTTVAIDKTPTGSLGSYLYVIGRRISATAMYRARIRVLPTNKVNISLTRNSGSSTEAYVVAETGLAGVTYTPGMQLNVRLQVTGTGTTTLRLKVWPVGTTEPATWQQSGTDTTAALQAAGAVGVGGYVSAGTSDAPVTLTVRNFSAKPTQ